MEFIIIIIAIMVVTLFIDIYSDNKTKKRYVDRFDKDKQAKIKEEQERIDRDNNLKEKERIDRDNTNAERERIENLNKAIEEREMIEDKLKAIKEKERIDSHNKAMEEKERLEKERLEMQIAKKSLRIEMQNAKKSLSVLEAAEIARAALKQLRISDLKELIPFIHTEEQLDQLISDFNRELLPVYEDLILNYGIKKYLVGNEKYSEILNFCLEFGKNAIRKKSDITLEHKPLDERNIKSEPRTKEREIKKVASWAEIKKKIDLE